MSNRAINNRAAQDKVVVANTYQPRAHIGRILTETYQPRGSDEVPKIIPQLVSGVATPPTQSKANGKQK